jgi:hypothetical protein
MIPAILNTAGEPEREARSRRWNALEALGLACVAFGSAWLLAYAWGVLGGNRWARDFGAAPLYGIMVFAFFISPWLHRDTAESWGLGNPRRLWQLLRTGTHARRWRTLAAALVMFGGLVWLCFAQWPRVVRACHLPASARDWPESLPGTVAVLAFGAILATLLVTCAVRHDNFGPAFLTALKVSAALAAFALGAAVVQRGWPVVKEFQPQRYALGVAGYFFWGCFQQLLFCAWFGTRLRKAFGPTTASAAIPLAGRLRYALLGGLAGAGLLAPSVWLAVRWAHGEAVVSAAVLGWFAGFAFPVGAAWGWWFSQDRKRMVVATLSGSFFGLIHIDSYGLVLGTWLMGTILAWIFMEDRRRNIAALGFIHGFLGTTFAILFNGPEAGALRISYRVGPWNVKEPTAVVLIIPVLCFVCYAALTVWCGFKLAGSKPGDCIALGSPPDCRNRSPNL